jgi:hypothetical protein
MFNRLKIKKYLLCIADENYFMPFPFMQGSVKTKREQII